MVKGDLLFRLHDPGALFDKNNPGIAASIKSIQERAAQLDADLDIEANHKGVSITLITPAQ
jgi:signal transduction histidine kinase